MTATINPHRKLRSETCDLTLRLGEGGVHRLAVSLAYDDGGVLREVAFVGRGKIGHGLDDMLRELGIQLSRAIQGRDPDSGAPIPPPAHAAKLHAIETTPRKEGA